MDADTKVWLNERIDRRLGFGLAIAWFVLLQVAMALEPTTHEPEPWFGVVFELVTTGLLATMAVGVIMQRRFGVVASLGAALFFTAESIACPVSGHHPFGAWWFGQMACVLALVAGSILALRQAGAVLPPHAAPIDAVDESMGETEARA
jgi:hypothetical protein